jgi:simple sugar transport system permease protein
MKREGSFNPISPFIQDSAKLTRFFKDPIRFHIGFFIALGVAWLVWWFLFRTKWGFELRTVGSNPHAAKYAGMNVPVTMVMAMALAGAMAGLAGANEVLGVNYTLAAAFSSGYGFDAIALALLGKSHPAGVVAAAILFGFLSNGAIKMQVMGIPVDIITIIQALVIIFVAAPAIVRTIYHLKEPEKGDDQFIAAALGGD